MRYPARSCRVSSVSSIRPAFITRLSLSSIRALMLATALHLEKILRGSIEASPYLAFFSSSRASSFLHFDFILLSVFI